MATIGEHIVEGIAWYVADPLASPPASIATMSRRERDRTVAALRRMVETHGSDGAMAIAAGIAEHMRTTGADAATWTPDLDEDE